MSKTYTPRAGSVPARAIAFLKDRGVLKSADLADLLEIDPKSLTACLALALNADLIQSQREGNGNVYCLGDGQAHEELNEASTEATEPFNCARYLDGDLVIMGEGVQEVEGGFIVKAPFVGKLEDYLKLTTKAPAAAWPLISSAA